MKSDEIKRGVKMDFYMKSAKNNFLARLTYIDGEFVLKKGSTVSKNVSKHFKSYKTVIKRREEAGITDDELTLKKDIAFNSSSVAGEFVCGSSCNGPSSWKTESGITLKEWMQSL